MLRTSLSGRSALPLVLQLTLSSCNALTEPVPLPSAPPDASQGADAALPESPFEPSDAGGTGAVDAGAASVPAVPHVLREVEANGYVFNVWIAGPEQGETVLLLHGFPQTSYEWHRLVPELVARGYRVIAPDQRGYSPKARPPEIEAYRVVTLGYDIIALADALGARTFHLVGHDWGGGVAWLVAKLLPLRVLSLTAVSTPHPDAMKRMLEDPSSCQHDASSYMDVLVEPGAAAGLVTEGPEYLPDRYTDFPPASELNSTVLQDEAAMEAALAWYRANIVDRKFDTLSLGAIEVPTLVAFGADEQFFCRDTAELSAEFTDAPFRFELLEGVGHWIPEQAHDRLLALFLSHAGPLSERVQGAVPPGPDSARPLGAGLSGFACKGAPRFEVPQELVACDDICAEGHCLPSSLLGDDAALLPACSGSRAGDVCVPDAISRTLGRFALTSCTPWLGGPGACVPRCLAGTFSLFLGREGCGEQELCAPCTNPLTGESTGACDEHCAGL